MPVGSRNASPMRCDDASISAACWVSTRCVLSSFIVGIADAAGEPDGNATVAVLRQEQAGPCQNVRDCDESTVHCRTDPTSVSDPFISLSGASYSLVSK